MVGGAWVNIPTRQGSNTERETERERERERVFSEYILDRYTILDRYNIFDRYNILHLLVIDILIDQSLPLRSVIWHMHHR